MIGSTNSGKSSTAKDVTKMKGFFNTYESKETSFFWQFIITSPEEKPFKITEYDHVGNILNSFEFNSNEIDRVKHKIASYRLNVVKGE